MKRTVLTVFHFYRRQGFLIGDIFYWTNCMSGIDVDKFLDTTVPFLRRPEDVVAVFLMSPEEGYCSTQKEAFFNYSAGPIKEITHKSLPPAYFLDNHNYNITTT